MKKKLQPERMGLQPYFIPPHRFMGKEWYVAEGEGPRWYYHRPRRAPSRVSSQVLDASLDEGLKPVVVAARSMGLISGPSCEGHLTARHTPKLTRSLRRQAAKVRGSGLRVRNVETGRLHLWRDRSYRLDAEILRQSAANEEVFHLVGILPLTGPASALQQVQQVVSNTPGAWTTVTGPWLNVWVGGMTEQGQRAIWSRIAEGMRHA